ncbi:hypothetical protein NRA27_17900 [Acinetobacter baumannii]|nr:hypothetical protein [Acinetobacter baumannii]
MSIDWGAAGVGVLAGYSTFKQEQKEKEQRDYERARQDEADRQKLELHNQAVKQNQQTLDTNAKAMAEANRRELLGQKIGQYQQFKQANNIDAAAKLYIDTANSDNIGREGFDPNHALSYVVDPKTNTATINLVDRKTGAVIKEARKGVGIDDFISATYQQIDPTAYYETARSAAAKQAEEERKNAFDLRKIGIQAMIDMQKDNNKFNNELELGRTKFGYDSMLEQYRQDQQNYRTNVTVDGQKYAADSKSGGKGGNYSPLDYARFTIQQESKGQHYGPNGQLLPSYDPKSTARGAGQFTQGTRDMVLKNSGIDAYKSPEDALRATVWLQGYNERLLGGDSKAAAIAHYAGAGEVQKWMNQAKKDGVSWEARIPPKYQERARVFDQTFGSGNPLPQQEPAQPTKNRSNFATGLTSTVNKNVHSVATKMAEELGLAKNTAGLIGGLSSAQNSIVKFTTATSTAKRAQAFNDVYSAVLNSVSTTEKGALMTPQQLKGYALQKAAELTGASSLAEAGEWINKPNVTARQKAEANRPKATMSGDDIDKIISGSVEEAKPAQKPTPKTGTVINPFMTEGLQKALNNASPQNGTPFYLRKTS